RKRQDTGRSQFLAYALGLLPRGRNLEPRSLPCRQALDLHLRPAQREHAGDQVLCPLRRLLQSLQNFGHFSPLVFPAVFISFHSALHFAIRSLPVVPDLSFDFSLVVPTSAAARSTGRMTMAVPARNAAENTMASERFNMEVLPEMTARPDQA